MREERWVLLLSMPRWLFAPPAEGKTQVFELKARAQDFFAGEFAKLWEAHRWESGLPTMAKHLKSDGKSADERLKATIEFMKLAARRRRLGQGITRMQDVPQVPPSKLAYQKLRGLLGAEVDSESTLAARDTLEQVWREQQFDRPEPKAVELAAFLADPENRVLNIKKWRPRLFAARNKKQPAGDGLRTEHIKPFFESLENDFCILFEAIERFAMPDSIARLASTVLSTALLKRLDNGTPHISAGLRPIGMGSVLFKEAWRARAGWAAKTLGPVLLFFGQMAVGLRSGGEGVATALQILCDAPALGQRTVIVAFDYSNAYSTTNLDKTASAVIKFIDWLPSLDEASKKRLGIEDIGACVSAARSALNDLAYLRTHHGEVLTVVDGVLERFQVLIGLTQGGLYSMLLFCIAVCMLVFKPLKEKPKFSKFYPKAIADDTHLPAEIKTVEDVELLAEWCHEYVDLSKSALNLGANPRKFKMLQHEKWTGTDLDLAKHLHLFPSQQHEGKLKRPTIVHGALKVNGVAVGYQKEARVKIIEEQVKANEQKLKMLEHLLPALGAQTTELYGRFTIKPSTAFNHQMRGNEPSISMEPLEHAAASQARLYRAITATSPDEIRDIQHDANPNGPTERRCEVAMHLALKHGGAGWAHPRLHAAGAHAGCRVDCIYLLRRLEDVSPYVPPPDQWIASGIPLLAETATFLVFLVQQSKGFKEGPSNEEEKAGWTFIHSKLVAQDGSLIFEGFEEIGGHHAQHVFNEALQQDMVAAIVDDPTVHPATRAHFRATRQLGAGAVMGIDIIETSTELTNEEFIFEAQGYLNHPKSAITLATRCLGSDKHLCVYHALRLTGRPPCRFEDGKSRRVLTLFEHYNGTHWDGCKYGGGLGVGHASQNELVMRIVHQLGYSARVDEIRLGPRDPSRPHHPLSNPNQKGDGLFGNFTKGPKLTVWDGTTTTAVPLRDKTMLRKLAQGTAFATDFAEKVKVNAKERAASCSNYHFLPWATSTRGGLGKAAAEFFTKGFAERVAEAKTDQEKWLVRAQRKRFLQENSAIMARRNWMIFNRNASPRNGGTAPPPPPLEFD